MLPPTLPQLVGILNLTPDSFSDGGDHFTSGQAVAHALQLVEQGASVIDIGAESTRPGAIPLSAEEEWERLATFLPPLIQALQGKAQISLDTRHAATAKQAIALGVDWINDVSGCEDKAMVACLAKSRVKVVLMHNLGIPADKRHTLPEDKDPVALVKDWAEKKIKALAKQGIAKERLVLDPGIGFGKTAAQSLVLLQRIHELAAVGVPLYVGHSRKSFLETMTALPPAERDMETVMVSAHLARQGVEYLRVHDVALHRRLLG